MRVVLWDTRKFDVSKDFAGGYGVGQFPGGNRLAGFLVRRMFKRDHRPTALNFAYLAAIFPRWATKPTSPKTICPRAPISMCSTPRC